MHNPHCWCWTSDYDRPVKGFPCSRHRVRDYCWRRHWHYARCIVAINTLYCRRQRSRYVFIRTTDGNQILQTILLIFLFTAIATGTIVQLRFLGGAIGLAIASNILNGRLAHHLKGVLTSHELHLFLENATTVQNLSPHLQDEVKSVFAESYRTQLIVMIGFAAAQLPAVLLLIKPGRQLAADKEKVSSASSSG